MKRSRQQRVTCYKNGTTTRDSRFGYRTSHIYEFTTHHQRSRWNNAHVLAEETADGMEWNTRTNEQKAALGEIKAHNTNMFENLDVKLSTQITSIEVKLLSALTGGKPEKEVEVTKCEVRVAIDKCEVARDVKEFRDVKGDCDTTVTISSQVDSWEEFVPQGCDCDDDVVTAHQNTDSGRDLGVYVESEVESTTKSVECVGGQRGHANFVDTQIDWGKGARSGVGVHLTEIRSSFSSTEIRTSISPSSAAKLNTTSALANHATEAGKNQQLVLHISEIVSQQKRLSSLLGVPVYNNIAKNSTSAQTRVTSQPTIAKLPVPPLEKTLEKYLRGTVPGDRSEHYRGKLHPQSRQAGPPGSKRIHQPSPVLSPGSPKGSLPSETLPIAIPACPPPPYKSSEHRTLLSTDPIKTISWYTVARLIEKEERLEEDAQKMLKKLPSVENLADWWLKYAYLSYRLPVVVHSSPGIQLPHQSFERQEGHLTYATRFIQGALSFKKILDESYQWSLLIGFVNTLNTALDSPIHPACPARCNL
uniref:Choline/carnitine acyltransferase domain-containing protein n=1 Tax=Timema douglasi TaxID=61478 RepID=A0A7R8ZAV4_TIMDO|nr:unnamed protein product [Timema douglasi]